MMLYINGYPARYEPSSPYANKSGLVYEHILVAENALGRKLKSGEVVHHLDKNKANNAANNLIVFENKNEHTRFHSKHCDMKLLIQNEDGSYRCDTGRREGIPRGHKECPVCGSIMSHKANMCQSCYKSFIAKDIPNKDTIQNDLIVHNGNFTAVGRMYGVTSKAVERWCKKYNIPYHSKDYKNAAVAQLAEQCPCKA